MSKTVAEPEAEPFQRRRGYVALLFSDICDYTRLAEELDPEEASRLKGQLLEQAVPIITTHGGEVVQLYGDGILAVFGFPTAREDSARRAIEAALELHAYVRNSRWTSDRAEPLELRMHSGVHAGVVFGQSGSLLHGKYDLSGDAVNTTARLCSAAERDALLVSAPAIRGLEEFFETEPPIELALKGKREPFSLCRVLGRTNVRTRFDASTRRGLTSFVGREAELAQLAALSESSAEESGKIAVVAGPAGVGKTRLLEEWRARQTASGVAVFLGSCDSYSELAPLEPFLQILSQALRLNMGPPRAITPEIVEQRLSGIAPSLGTQLPTVLQLLSVTPRTTSVSTGDQTEQSVVRAFVELLEHLSNELRLVVMLDDWQWADDASRALLVALLEHVPTRGRVCFVVGTRSVDPGVHALKPKVLVHLQPFHQAESQRVMQHLLPRELSGEFIQSLHHLSGGNPLFLEELCRSLPATFWHGSGPEMTAVPSTLQAVIHTRIARLPLEQSDLLRTASVVGIEFSAQLLEELTGNSRLAEPLLALQREDLIYSASDPDRFRFKHGIARDIIYETVLLDERRRVHAAVARVIAANTIVNDNADEAESLAYHYSRSGDYAQAARFSEIAGTKALQQSSLDRARFHYAAALTALEKLPRDERTKRRWLAISLMWATPCAYSPRRDDVLVIEHAASIASELGDQDSRALACNWRGWFYFVLGDYDRSIAAYREGLEFATAAQNNRLIAQLWSNLGQVYGAAGEYDEALPLLARGLEFKKAHGQSTSRTRALGFAHACACKGLVHSDRGEFGLVDQLFQEAIEVVHGSNHPMEASILSQQCMAVLRRGDWIWCEEASQRTIRVAERASIPFTTAIATFFLAYSRWMLERKHEWLVQMCRAVEWLDSMEQGLYSSFVLGCMADAYASIQSHADATKFAQRALERVHVRDLLGEAAAYRVFARIHGARGQAAARETEAALANSFNAAKLRASPREHTLTLLVEAELLLERGDRTLALARAAQARSEFMRMSMPWYGGCASRLVERATTSTA